jgi:hypothetical protein
MDEPGWITFYTAAHLLRERGKGWAEARKLLRAACRDEDITAMRAPDDEPEPLPFEYWTTVKARDWRDRAVDQDDDIVVMLNEDDFNRWRARSVPGQAVSPAGRDVQCGQQSKRSRRDDVIVKLLKDGKPGDDLDWKSFRAKVREECGAEPTTRGYSDETITKVTRKIMNGSK